MVVFNKLLFPGSLSSEYQRYVVNYETAVKNYHESLACHTYKSFFDVRPYSAAQMGQTA